MKISLSTILIIIVCPFILSGQKVIKAKKLLKDFDALVEAFEAHPDPYRYVSQSDFEQLTDSIRNTITEPMDVISFFKICSPIVHYIKDGHTSLRLPQNFMKKYMKEFGVFPYGVHLTDEEKMFVIKNYGEDETIRLGAEIKSINGVGISDFLNGIDKYTFYETNPFRNTRVESEINQLLYLYFGSFTELEIKYFTDIDRVHTVQNIDYKLYEKEKKEQEVNISSLVKMSKPYEYKKLSNEVGLLKVHSFVIYKEENFKRFLKKMFSNIKKDNITSLIIDVRGNLGGYPRASAEIFHYISDIPFKTMALTQMKISTTYRNMFREMYPRVNLNSVHFRKNKYSVDMRSLFNKEVGTYATDLINDQEQPITMENEYEGDLYLLTDRTSYSAASSFAATFRCYGLGLIVGEPTGGTRVFFGNSMSLKLKNSRLSFRIGTVKNYTSCLSEYENEPVMPDVLSYASTLDRMNDSDQTLFFTMNLIKKIKRNRKKKESQEAITRN